MMGARASGPLSEHRAEFYKLRGAGQRMIRAAVGAVGMEETTMHSAIPFLVGFAKSPWNKGRLTGQKRPLKPKEVWAIRIRLQLERRRRDLALFNLAIDSKLRGCDLVRLRVRDVYMGGRVQDRAMVIQRKTGRPVQFEITKQSGDPRVARRHSADK
jgi:hypothetical protein